MTKQDRNYSRYSTQWAGQFYVAAELCKREFLVSFPLGNAKETDLIITGPKGTKFRVEVKTQRKRNFWRYKQREVSPDLFYILVYLNEIGQNPQFHILTSQQAMLEWKEYYDKHPKVGRKPTDYGLGANPSSIEKYEAEWRKLPE